MKATGIIRNVDDLGRIVLPMELRRNLGINIKDPMEIFVDGNTIVVKKHEPNCTFCGGEKNITQFKGKNICSDCLKELNKQH